MIKVLNSKNKNFYKDLKKFLELRKININYKSTKVLKIIEDVKRNGDRALIKYEKKFNSNSKIKITKKDIKKSIKKLDLKVKRSIDLAYNRILKFHSNQKYKGFKFKDELDNKFEYKFCPIEKIGIYVPGGSASYPSTVLMNAIPALLANVKNITMVTPSSKGNLNPGVIYAAYKCNIKNIYNIGGAQAIAALAYGTKKIEKVNKIVGPGNKYVSAAKKEIFGEVGIDMIAGPSEITVVADDFSNSDWIASDLISQAEHDKFSQSILISSSFKILKKTENSIKKQLKSLERKRIASFSLSKFGLFIKTFSNKEISKIINIIAPEHLELNIKNYNIIKNKINNVGSIFLGKYSPEAVGDYLAGPNHVLPTTGTAKFSSGLSVYDFLKRISYINLSKKGIENLGPSVITLSEFEGLKGHSNSVKLRIKK
tara:strand:+ start:990 stop:2270 length:1281 start_codon:yes stop_codon:yes gene_type:complete